MDSRTYYIHDVEFERFIGKEIKKQLEVTGFCFALSVFTLFFFNKNIWPEAESV